MPDISEPVFSYPTSVVMFHLYAVVLVGGALLPNQTALMDFAERPYQSPPGNGDSFQQAFYLAGGTYTFTVMGEEDANCGRLDWYIDNVKVVSLQDWYAAVDAKNVVKTAVVTVVGNGRHTLRGVVNDKNGASTNYVIEIVAYSLS